MSNFLSNKKNIAFPALGCLIFLFFFTVCEAHADTQIIASYSPGIQSSFPEIENALKELLSVRSSNYSVKIHESSPIYHSEAISKISADDLDIMVVISSEIEHNSQNFFDVQNRIRESVLVSFIAVSPKVDHITHKPLADIESNYDQPLLYPNDESSRKLINDIIIKCAQGTLPQKIVIKPVNEAKSLITPAKADLTGVLVKLIHFNERVIGLNLLADLDQASHQFLGMPIVEPQDIEKTNQLKKCVENMKSRLWDHSLKYRIIFANESPSPSCRSEVLRDYKWVKKLQLENLEQTHIVEKIENIVLLIRGATKEDADRRSNYFKRCLFDRYWNLQGYSNSAAECAAQTQTEKDKNNAAVAKEALINYVKGFYLLTTDTFPTVTYAKDILLPDICKYYSRIGDMYTRREITEQLGKDHNPLDENQLSALNTSIKKYEIYLNFRQDATDLGHFDLYLLYAMERYARLKKIKFDHYYLRSDPNTARYLKDAIDSLKNLYNINEKILSEDKYSNILENSRFDFYTFDDKIIGTLSRWEKQL